MTSPPPAPDGRSAPRRGFLAQLAAGLAGLATTGVVARPLAGAPRPLDPRAAIDTATAPRGPWDLSWVDKLTTPHRQLFDSPNVSDGAALNKAHLYLAGYNEVYGTRDADVNVVIVVRHRAMPIVLSNAMWSRYDFLAETTKLKDPTSGEQAKRNPFLDPKPTDQYTLVWADGGLDTLIQRGVIVLACSMALRSLSSRIAGHAKLPSNAVEDELRRSLVPGVILMPSGIFAVARAEEAGCHYLAAF